MHSLFWVFGLFSHRREFDSFLPVTQTTIESWIEEKGSGRVPRGTGSKCVLPEATEEKFSNKNNPFIYLTIRIFFSLPQFESTTLSSSR